MASIIQPSFSSGELTPSAYARVDLAKYQTGLKTLRNMITKVHGGVVNRPGTEYVVELKSSAVRGRLIPFEFSTTQSYILLFGETSMQVVKDGGIVLETAKNITATTNATPVVITSAGHGYSNGDRVFVTGTGLAGIDNRIWTIANVAANTMELSGSTAPGGTSATGTVSRVFNLVTPYTEAQLPSIKYAQLNDVMTMVHGSVRMKDLSRTGHAAWSIADTVFEQGPFQEINVDAAKTMQASAATGAGVTITAAGHTPFTSSHVGMLLYIEQKDYGTPWEVSKAVVTNDIRRAEGKYYRAQNNATTGTLRPSHADNIASDGAVNWLYVNNGWGVVLITGFTSSTVVTGTVLVELSAAVVSGATHKWAFGSWGGDRGWPTAITYFQQRRLFAGTPAEPSKIWCSGTDAFTFFGKSSPIADDDSFAMTLASGKGNAIRHLDTLGKLIAFTAGSKWVSPDDANNATLTPSRRSARPQGSVGASDIRPVTIEESLLYVADKGQTVHDVAYQLTTDLYAGSDLSLLSRHLVEKHTIVAAAYQHVPFQCYWCVRDDGVLLGLTYLKEHQVWGWHRHDTDGFFEDVATISEGSEHRVYFQVRRTVNGQTKRYIERMASRFYDDVRFCKFLDSSLTYDGRNTGLTKTMTLSGGTLWDTTETLTLTAGSSHFVSTDVGSEIHFYYEPSFGIGRVLKLSITAYTSGTVVSVKASHDVPVGFRSAPITNWGHARKVLSGLHHLVAKTVSALVDGNVAPSVVVAANGNITLQDAGVVITAGLPFMSDFETLNMNIPASGSMLEKQKIINAVRLYVEETRGVFAGPDADHLTEHVQRSITDNYDQPVSLKTGVLSVRVLSKWSDGGNVFVRQSDPLPMSILAVMPEFDVGGAK